MIKTIIFDFDGVIFNSHKIKTNAFYEVFKSYGKKIAIKAKRFHQNNIGKSRYFKFKFILKNFLNKKITKNEILKLDENFDAFVKKKEILGAGLDVFMEEPYSGKLINLENVILTPHIGSYSKEVRSKMEQEALKNILESKI